MSNVFRHVLDERYVGFDKVWGLKIRLEQQYPGLKVDCAVKHAQDWLCQDVMADLDGVVLAIGSPTLERLLSRRFKMVQRQLPVVFTWLEAMDLGGHSVLTSTRGEGCLECLYRDEEGAQSLLPRTAFLEQNQRVTRNLTGCASVFVPYGALQARRTGLMAADQLLGAITHGTDAPAYQFWVGTGTAAQAQGLKTTNWWRRAPSVSQSEATASVFGRGRSRAPYRRRYPHARHRASHHRIAQHGLRRTDHPLFLGGSGCRSGMGAHSHCKSTGAGVARCPAQPSSWG